MGCGTSRNSVVPLTDRRLSLQLIDVSTVHITEPLGGVSFVKDTPKVVFIFGGPGSAKGRIVDNIVTTFNAQVICIESLIIQSLPKRVQQVMSLQTIREMSKLVRDDPSHVTLQWALELCRNALKHTSTASDHGLYIVDMVPSLKWLLKNECLIKECTQEMTEFELQYPISFAIHLSVEETSFPSTLGYSHRRTTTLQQQTTAPQPAVTANSTGVQPDEADNTRAKKRYNAHQTAMSPYLEYFTNTQRLITIDMTSSSSDYNYCSLYDSVWMKICQLFTDKGIEKWKPINLIIIFTNELLIGEFNINDSGMEVIHLNELLSSNNITALEDIVSVINGHINTLTKSNCPLRHFVIDTSNTYILNCSTNALHELKDRSLTFTDTLQEEGVVNNTVTIHPFTKQINSLIGLGQYFKSVTTSHDHTLLFPSLTDDRVCERIAHLINK